jgi:cAMP-dependent protein kinase regulator
MSLPANYLEEINALSREVSKSQPIDVLQFCANHFQTRLEEERNKFLTQQNAAPVMNTNPFGAAHEAEDTFGGPGEPSPFDNPFAPETSNPFAGQFNNNSPFGVPSFDGTHDMITEEEEDIHSPTTPSFKPQYSMGGPSVGGPGARSPRGRRNHSPASGGGGSSRRPQSSQSGNYAGQSHLSPNAAANDFPSNYNRNRRTSVSAESLIPSASSDDWTPPSHPKTEEQQQRLRSAVSGNFLFTHLDEEQERQVLLALVEKPLPNKDMRVITQGDVGDYFYVVERGEFDVYVNEAGVMTSGPDGMGKKVASIGPGGSFGELALMYNAPRAATVVSTTSQNILWALDRVTFRRILMENTFKRRRRYEAILEKLKDFPPLQPSERSKIADALDTEIYEPGSQIIREGDAGDRFYIIEKGKVEVHTNAEGHVDTLDEGMYFGELALIDDKPRAATIIAQTKVTVAFLGKDGFQRLLGSVADIMKRNDPRLRKDSRAGMLDSFDGASDPLQAAAARQAAIEV